MGGTQYLLSPPPEDGWGTAEEHCQAINLPLSFNLPCRVGYGAFPLGLIQYLWRAKQPYNVSVAAEVCWVGGWVGGRAVGRCMLLAVHLGSRQPARSPGWASAALCHPGGQLSALLATLPCPLPCA